MIENVRTATVSTNNVDNGYSIYKGGRSSIRHVINKKNTAKIVEGYGTNCI